MIKEGAIASREAFSHPPLVRHPIPFLETLVLSLFSLFQPFEKTHGSFLHTMVYARCSVSIVSMETSSTLLHTATTLDTQSFSNKISLYIKKRCATVYKFKVVGDAKLAIPVVGNILIPHRNGSL